jgi:hypothetical protein
MPFLFLERDSDRSELTGFPTFSSSLLSVLLAVGDDARIAPRSMFESANVTNQLPPAAVNNSRGLSLPSACIDPTTAPSQFAILVANSHQPRPMPRNYLVPPTLLPGSPTANRIACAACCRCLARNPGGRHANARDRTARRQPQRQQPKPQSPSSCLLLLLLGGSLDRYIVEIGCYSTPYVCPPRRRAKRNQDANVQRSAAELRVDLHRPARTTLTARANVNDVCKRNRPRPKNTTILAAAGRHPSHRHATVPPSLCTPARPHGQTVPSCRVPPVHLGQGNVGLRLVSSCLADPFHRHMACFHALSTRPGKHGGHAGVGRRRLQALYP